MKIANIDDLHADAGWRNVSFVKVTTDDGLAGWSEYRADAGNAGVTGARHGDRQPRRRVDELRLSVEEHRRAAAAIGAERADSGDGLIQREIDGARAQSRRSDLPLSHEGFDARHRDAGGLRDLAERVHVHC